MDVVMTDDSIESIIDNITNQIEELKIIQTTTNNMVDRFDCENKINELDIQMKNIMLDKDNLTNVVEKLCQMDMDENEAITNFHGVDHSKFKGDPIIPFGAKYLPLEVPNEFCYKYFDDEDYVYFTLRIPEDILQHISNIPLGTCENEVELFQKISIMLKNVIDNNNADMICDINKSSYYYKYEFLNNEIYYQIINIYVNVLKFYYNINTTNILNWSIFGNNLNQILDDIFERMRAEICFSYLEDNYKCLDRIHKELVYGLRLIMNQMDVIRNFYRKHNLAFQTYNIKHQNRFIRLLNNFCVLMIFLKFNNVDLGEDVTYEDFVKFNTEVQDLPLDDTIYHQDIKSLKNINDMKLSVNHLSSARMDDF